jgi:hypothetical protein
MHFLKARANHIGHIANGWWAMILAMWSLVTAADTVIEKWGSDAAKKWWDGIWLLPKVGWKGWLIGLLVITVLLIFEGSYRHSRRQEDKLLAVIEEFRADRPRIAFTPLTTDLAGWKAIENSPQCAFQIKHYAGRAARFLRIDPIRSPSGIYELRFGEVDLVKPPTPTFIHFEVWDVGRPKGEDAGSVEMLLSFFRDNPDSARRRAYELIMRFRDGKEEIADTIRMCCEYPDIRLSTFVADGSENVVF